MAFNYKGLVAEAPKATVTDEEVEEQLEAVRSSYANITVITDRPAAEGDEVVLDYAGFCDGVQFEGGTAEQQELTLGSGMFIPGFEEQLIGAEIGQEVDVKVTFPEEYHAEALVGKEAVFHCKIHEIHEKSEFELNDEFAQAVANCSLAELRFKFRFALLKDHKDSIENELKDKLIRMAAATLDYDPPKEQVADAAKALYDDFAKTVTGQGIPMELYCQYTGQKEEEIRDSMRPRAIETLKVMNTVGKIAGLEGIMPTEEEIAQELKDTCEANGATEEQLRESYGEELNELLFRNVLVQKVMQLVRDNAVITYN